MKTRFVAGMAASMALVIFSPIWVENTLAGQTHPGARTPGASMYGAAGRSASYAYRYPRYLKSQTRPGSVLYPRYPQQNSIYPSYRGYNPYYKNYYYRSHIGSIGRPYVHVRYDYRDNCHPYYHHYHHDERRR